MNQNQTNEQLANQIIESLKNKKDFKLKSLTGKQFKEVIDIITNYLSAESKNGVIKNE